MRTATRWRFAVLVSIALLVPYNLRFWHETLNAVGGPTLHGVLAVLALGVMLVMAHAMLIGLLPGRRTAPIVAVLLFLIASVVAHFSNVYGVYFDSAMVRNVFETNVAESAELLNARLLIYVALLGVLPAMVSARVVLQSESLKRYLISTALALTGGTALIAVLAVTFSASLASYLREHRAIRYLITPANVVYGVIRYARGAQAARPFEYLEGSVHRVSDVHQHRPLLVFLVVGETARAANFPFAGYGRQTTPRLATTEGLTFFRKVRSCGTSTSISVPCMFSHQGREAFDAGAARYRSNLLDAVSLAGVDVEWRDNNSGCKHVCDRVRQIRPCTRERCFDDSLLAGLEAALRRAPRNRLIVFHQAGSHGPAYHERYPASFEVFTPACRSANLGKCSREAIVNAYDNTLRYTDHVLAEQIALLKSLQAQFDTALLYVSDHGESLGENGVFLHAAPYFVAPDTQTHVPLFIWMSENFGARRGIQLACVRAQAGKPASHDNLYHTVLGMLEIRTSAYRPALDLLSPCRGGNVS